MGVQAAQDLAIQHAWKPDVSPIAGLASHFFDPIVTDRACADDFIAAVGRGH
jgi:hypothetical protein